jgi:hypothetical protein
VNTIISVFCGRPGNLQTGPGFYPAWQGHSEYPNRIYRPESGLFMQKRKDATKTERRAKSLLLRKDIPPEKMEVVRSLIQNSRLAPVEKYSAIIDIIKACPDKPVLEVPRKTKIEIKDKSQIQSSEKKITPPLHEPPGVLADVNGVYKKF